MIHISLENYVFLIATIRNAYTIFMWGFLFYAVFVYLIQERHYKIPLPKKEERLMRYNSSWMLLWWVTTLIILLGIDLTHPFVIT